MAERRSDMNNSTKE